MLLINCEQQVTPKLGLKLHQGKMISNVKLRSDNQHNCSVQGAQLLQLSYDLLFPTCVSHPKKCAPSLLCNPSVTPLPFYGFRKMSDRKSQSHVTNSQCTGEQFIENLSLGENYHRPEKLSLRQKISHLERMIMGMTTCLFNRKSLA
jgi:hypothetical protein